MTIQIDRIRAELLHGDDTWLRRRRQIATISALLASEFALVGMHQYGVIGHLPDPPGFDSDAVTTSRAAYPLGVPDASLAVVGCGLLIALAVAGGTRRTGRSAWLDLALGAGIAVGSGGALVYAREMIKLRRACAYCITATTGLLSLVPLAARGVLSAWRELRA